MGNKNVYACLLAGGKGTRLWPLSTEKHSKSFIRIGKRKPLIIETMDRFRGLTGTANIIIVVDKAKARLIRRFAKGIPKRNILVEPFGRSTASAVGLAAIRLSPDDIMVVLPTDSVIKNINGFRKTMKAAVNFVSGNKNMLVSVGIKPAKASTAYGYIKIKDRKKRGIYSVDKFMEKPKEEIAGRLVKKANYLWNAGIFVFRAGDILEAIRKHAPVLYRELMRIRKDKRKMRRAYSRMKNVSIDYQIMEKAKNLYCVKGKFSWSDLGSWPSLEGLFRKDKNGNICFGRVALTGTRDSIVYNSGKATLGAVGLKNTIVAVTENGTLVCGKRDAEKVKKLVKALEKHR